MKVFIANVEQHTYPIIEDNYSTIKVFTDRDVALEWAKSECERIMHEEFDRYISDDEDEDYTYEWGNTGWGENNKSYISNFEPTENGEKHFCCYHIEEQEIVGTEGYEQAWMICAEDIDKRRFAVSHLSENEKRELVKKCVGLISRNESVAESVNYAIEYTMEREGYEQYAGDRYVGVQIRWKNSEDEGDSDCYDIIQIGGEKPKDMTYEDQRIIFYCEDWDDFVRVLRGGEDFEVVKVEEYFNRLG